MQLARLYVTYQRGEVKLHVQVLAQVMDQRRDRLAGVQLLVILAMQGGAVMAELAGVQVVHCSALQQLDVVAVLPRAPGAEGFEQMFFGFGAGEQVGAIALERQARRLRPLAPDFAAFPRQVQHWPWWLTGDQCLAEVAH